MRGGIYLLLLYASYSVSFCTLMMSMGRRAYNLIYPANSVSDMAVTLELYEVKNLCMEMAELGAANYVKQTRPGEDLISQREAYRLFQETRVKRWVRIGVVSGSRAGSTSRSKVLYSMAELLAADKSEKLNSLINK